MPFEIVRNDITKMNVDAIVNAANTSLLGGGGVDGAIHLAAGPELLAECRTLHGCPTGEARITGGYRLPAKYVIHTVGPVWHGGGNGEKALLASCYRNSLELAERYGCESIAFPLISAGAYGYPRDQAMAVAAGEITGFLENHEMTVYLVIFGRAEFLTGKQLFRDVQEYIDDVYADAHFHSNTESIRQQLWKRNKKAALSFDKELGSIAAGRPPRDEIPDGAAAPAFRPAPRPTEAPRPQSVQEAAVYNAADEAAAPIPDACPAAGPDWDRLLRQTDEGFSESLLRLIDERGMTDAECYKRANVDRKLFSKIRSNPAYRPSKPTVFAFAVALQLSLPETRQLLGRAGFALSHSSKFDIILEYFITHRRFNVFEINEVLFQFDMPLLGSGAG